MTLKNWKGKNAEDTAKELSALKEELFGLRLKKVTGQLEKQHRLQDVKREIARGLTYFKQEGFKR